TDIHGWPYNVSGDVTDSKGKPVTKFSSMHDGMGFFVIKPDLKEQYKASWKDAIGKTQQTPLPAAKKDGYVLMITQDAASIKFLIARPEGEVSQDAAVTVVG